MSIRVWYEYDDQGHEDGMSDGDGFDESNNHKHDEENEVDFEDQWTMRWHGLYCTGCRLTRVPKKNSPQEPGLAKRTWYIPLKDVAHVERNGTERQLGLRTSRQQQHSSWKHESNDK